MSKQDFNNNSSTYTYIGIVIIVLVIFSFLAYSVIQSTNPFDPTRPAIIGGSAVGAIILLALVKLAIASSKPNPYSELINPKLEREAKEQEQAQAAQTRLHESNPDAIHQRIIGQPDAVLGATIAGNSPWIIDDWATLPAQELAIGVLKRMRVSL